MGHIVKGVFLLKLLLREEWRGKQEYRTENDAVGLDDEAGQAE